MPSIWRNGRLYHTQDDNFIDDFRTQARMEGAIGNSLLAQHRQMHQDMAKMNRALGKSAWFMTKVAGKASWATAKFVGKSSFRAGKAVVNRTLEQSDHDRFTQRRGLS